MSRRIEDIGDPRELEERNARSFAAWANTYDSQPNPLLSLEGRYLERMLPDLAGHDVLDAGCGSGRWLRRLLTRKPRSLTGIDSSDAMLEASRLHGSPGVTLLKRSCRRTLLPARSFDTILCSFVLGYIDDIRGVALELSRIARSGCDLFVSDMHPRTQAALGWKRSFREQHNEIELDCSVHSLQQIITVFRDCGWDIGSALELRFGEPERAIFEAAGKPNRFEEAEQFPAIYLLHLRTPSLERLASPRVSTLLRGACCALGAGERVQSNLQISRGLVTRMVSEPLAIATSEAIAHEVDLSGCLMLPGFINAHDHLEFALFPRLARSLYSNAGEWARDIQNTFAEEIARHKAVPKDVRLWWGAIRNLLCGATTVCHHNPTEPAFSGGDFPIRVVTDFGWAHSLEFGGDLPAQKSAVPAGRPFIVHACEGIDDIAEAELRQLDRLGLLDEDLVLVHGLAITDEDAALVRRRRASLILCASSNHFLFGKTPEWQKWSGSNNLALGSDSPLTAAGDLLDELRFAIRNCGIACEDAYRLVTDGAKRVLRRSNVFASIAVGNPADLVVVRDTLSMPAERLAALSAANVELVMIGGRVQLASSVMLARLPAEMRAGLEPLWFDGMIRWLRVPVEYLVAEAERVLGEGQVRLGGKPVRSPQAKEIAHAH